MCDLLLEESNVQPVSTPITVCGDIHGQVYTLGPCSSVVQVVYCNNVSVIVNMHCMRVYNVTQPHVRI